MHYIYYIPLFWSQQWPMMSGLHPILNKPDLNRNSDPLVGYNNVSSPDDDNCLAVVPYDPMYLTYDPRYMPLYWPGSTVDTSSQIKVKKETSFRPVCYVLLVLLFLAAIAASVTLIVLRKYT